MSESEYSWGYCLNCMKNVPHFRAIRFFVFRVLDRLSFNLLEQLRIGPWYCAHCERKSYILNRELSNVPRHDPTESFGESAATDVAEQLETPLVGNFIKDEHSLVRRASRLKRFSEKYRDAIIRRVLAGKLTFSQAKQEQDVTEAELIDWIWDLVDRLEDKVESAKSAHSTPYLNHQKQDTESQENDIPGLVHVTSKVDAQLDDADLGRGPIIEGQVRPK